VARHGLPGCCGDQCLRAHPCRPDAVADLAPRLAEIDGVRESHSVAGADADIVVIVTVREHEDVARVVTEHIGREPGVLSTATMIAFRSFSQSDAADAFGDFG
jgi:DNA-binding Lrp family transcriptional regulator